MNINIVYSNYIDEKSDKVSVGGIQTYIYYLCNLLKKLDITPSVYQKSNADFDRYINGVYVHGRKVKKKNSNRELSKRCVSEAATEDIILFASEQFIIPTKQYSIAIQHGIAWDKPEHINISDTFNRMFVFLRAIRAYQRVKKIEMVNKLVCVDYNFVNWYRTQVAHQNVELEVIPNFSQIGEYSVRNNENVNIIFARRFFAYRGTRIFAKAIEKILKNHENVNVFIAGSGPDEKFLKEKFENNPKVKISSFETKDSLEIHKNYDIAVVPTLGSEGTSLSLLEAMAAGCSVIATNVGGMTNIILDGYNGLMINPDEDELYLAMEKLIVDKSLRMELSRKAYETVQKSFSHEIWEKRWMRILEEVLHESEDQC